MAEKVTFEAALSQLESIVRELEGGDASLDDSIKLFEKGIKLSSVCAGYLKNARQKVEQLVKDSSGEIGAQPFDSGDE